MHPERFQRLFNVFAPFITKQDTNYRNCILARNRLTITLRYLAESCSQQAVSNSFRVGESIVLKVLKEVFDALYTVVVGPSLFMNTINRRRVKADKHGISRVVKHTSFYWSNWSETSSHRVSKNTVHFITIIADFCLNPKTAGGGGVQLSIWPPLWFLEKCFFYREGETLVFCDF